MMIGAGAPEVSTTRGGVKMLITTGTRRFGSAILAIYREANVADIERYDLRDVGPHRFGHVVVVHRAPRLEPDFETAIDNMAIAFRMPGEARRVGHQPAKLPSRGEPSMDMSTPTEIVIGVDTHEHINAAVALDGLGVRLGTTTIPVSSRGYRDLNALACSFGRARACGIEGTSSYGAGLTRSHLMRGHAVVEVTRPNRQSRHPLGKSDPLDSESAGRSVPARQATACPKTGTGTAEMTRQIKVARDTAVKARAQAMLTLKTLIGNAPAALREQLDRVGGHVTLVRHLSALRPAPVVTTTASSEAALRALARRWLVLDAKIQERGHTLDALSNITAPTLKAVHCIATGTAGEMLIPIGDDSGRSARKRPSLSSAAHARSWPPARGRPDIG